MSPVQNLPECKECGACCAGWEVDVYSSDIVNIVRAERRLKRSLIEETAWDTIMRTTGGEQKRCVALRGRIGREVLCSIYRDRPATCRDFKRGEPGCIAAIERFRHRASRSV